MSTQKTLGDICDQTGGEIKTGPFGSQLHKEDYSEQGTPVVMPSDIEDQGISTESVARVSEEHVERLSQHQLSVGDIVYARRGDIGRCALITNHEKGWLCGTGCLRVSPGNGIVDPEFLYYHLRQPQLIEWIENQAVGATMPNLNTEILRSVPIDYPPLSCQKRIASILSAFDDLIENNRRRIEILEEMARTIYREWFVHFNYPGHENDAMKDSELGEIPEGWEVVSFDQIADVLSGGTPKTKIEEYWDGDIPFFSPKDCPSHYYVTDTDRTLSREGVDNCSSQLYSKNTVFITARGTVGKVVMPGRPMAMNQSCYALKGKSRIPQFFVFMAIKAKVKELQKQAHGATFDTIIMDTFKNIHVPKPPLSLISEFTEKISGVFDLILNLINRNQTLRQTRDLLLPRLISGDIEV